VAKIGLTRVDEEATWTGTDKVAVGALFNARGGEGDAGRRAEEESGGGERRRRAEKGRGGGGGGGRIVEGR
jgi:hypothetical protein